MSEQAHFRQRKPRNHHHPKNNNPSSSSDPTTTSSKKPTIISDILTNTNKKKHHFSSATFRGLGCTASPQVSVPSLIRTSANWEPTKNISTNSNTVVVASSSNNNNNKLKKKRLNNKNKKNIHTVHNLSYSNDNKKTGSFSSGNYNGGGGVGTSQSSLSLAALSSSCVGHVPDSVWCGPGIGLTTDAASVDCVVVSAPRHGRVKLDGVEKMSTLGHRERTYDPIRRMVSPEEEIHFLESEASAALVMPHYVSGSRFHRRAGNSYRDGLAEILMFQGDLRIGERSNRLDIYRDMRLDVDNMSYEELLELGDRIGYVSTGLGEDEINCCLRRTKLASFNDPTSSHTTLTEAERKCSICQEEYEEDDDDDHDYEMGRLHCGHLFHIDCIKHWLARKNMCPICKTEAVSHQKI